MFLFIGECEVRALGVASPAAPHAVTQPQLHRGPGSVHRAPGPPQVPQALAQTELQEAAVLQQLRRWRILDRGNRLQEWRESARNSSTTESDVMHRGWRRLILKWRKFTNYNTVKTIIFIQNIDTRYFGRASVQLFEYCSTYVCFRLFQNIVIFFIFHW